MTDLLPAPGTLADERPHQTGASASERPAVWRAPARERLLAAAVELLEQQDEASVSTRAITDRAGVTAPTLYHHFGDRDSLLEAAAAHHFEAELGSGHSAPEDPVEALEQAWDALVQYGRSHPHCFDLLFGATRTRQAGVAMAERRCQPHLTELARRGRLSETVEAATASFLAANIGAALMLIADPGEGEDLSLSRSSRNGILRSLVTDAVPSLEGSDSYVTAAIALNATLQAANPQQLSEPEFALFLQWLDRLSTPGQAHPYPDSADPSGH